MSQNGEAKADKYKGFLVGLTPEAEYEQEVLRYPPEEQEERWKAYLRRKRLEAEEYSRQRIEDLINAAK